MSISLGSSSVLLHQSIGHLILCIVTYLKELQCKKIYMLFKYQLCDSVILEKLIFSFKALDTSSVKLEKTNGYLIVLS